VLRAATGWAAGSVRATFPACTPHTHTPRSFINRDDLDFAAIASMQPTQEWDLQEENNGTLEYPTK
jgi:hypothetical protein